MRKKVGEELIPSKEKRFTFHKKTKIKKSKKETKTPFKARNYYYKMEDIRSFVTYNTGLEIPGMDETGPYYNNSLSVMLERASIQRAKVLIKTSNGSWYIKETNGSKTHEQIKNRLEQNTENRHKPGSRTWLLYY